MHPQCVPMAADLAQAAQLLATACICERSAVVHAIFHPLRQLTSVAAIIL